MSNLATFISLEKLFQALQHGRAELAVQLRSGSIVSVMAKGKKRLIYNSSAKDINNNQKALQDIVKRVIEQLSSGVTSEMTFRVKNINDKIRSVEIESDQNIGLNTISSSVS